MVDVGLMQEKLKIEEVQMVMEKLVMVQRVREQVDEDKLVGESIYMSLIRLKYFAQKGIAEKIEEDVKMIA